MPTKPSACAVDAGKLIRPLRPAIKRLLRDLVRTNSVSVPPAGNETPAQLVLRDFLGEQGIRAEVYDAGFLETSQNPLLQKGRLYRGRKNLSVRMSGRGKGKSLLLNGHMDTVTPAEGALVIAALVGTRTEWPYVRPGHIRHEGRCGRAGCGCLRAEGRGPADGWRSDVRVGH